MRAEQKAQMRTLSKENKKILRKMNRYLSARFLNTVLCRDLISDQIGMALESQKRGESYAQTIGMEPQRYCHALAESIPRRSFMEILWTLLSWLFAAMAVTVPLLYFYTLLFPAFSPIHIDGLAMQIPLAWIIKYFMVDAGLIFGYYLIRLLAYKNSPLVFILYFIGFLILFIFADNLVLKWIGERLLSVHAVEFFIGFAALSAFSFAMQYFAALLIAYKKQRQGSKIQSEEKQ